MMGIKQVNQHTIRSVAAFMVLALGLPFAASAGSLAVTINGDFDDWAQLAPVLADPPNDSTGNDDYTALYVSDDGSALNIRLQLANETVLQREAALTGGNGLELLIDGDANSSTGASIEGMGVELAIQFGNRTSSRYSSGGTRFSVNTNTLGLIMGPSYSGTDFEIRIPFVTSAGQRVISGPTIKMVFRSASSSDRMPNSGALSYTLSGTVLLNPDGIPLDRQSATDVRVYNQNVRESGFEKTPAPFSRLLNAVKPDIVCLQEQYTESTATVVEDVRAMLGWSAAYGVKENDAVIVSRWPILASGHVATHDNVLALIDLPDALSDVNLVVFSAHTPCCDNDSGRDNEHDAIAATWRNLLNGTGPFSIQGDEGVIITGDFNMVGFARQFHALRDGNIINNGSWGPDFSPGRAAGSLAVAPLRHTHRRLAYTWRNGSSSFAPGRIDFVFYSSDVMTLKNNYILDTTTLPAEVRTAYGLQSGDSTASDHRPIIADFQFLRATSFNSGWAIVGQGKNCPSNVVP